MKKSFVYVLTLLALLGLVAAGCGGDEEEIPADAIAVVDDREVKKADFDAWLNQQRQNYELQKRPFPKVGTPEYQQVKANLVRYLVERTQFVLAAEDMGVEVTDKEIDGRVKEIKSQYYGGNDRRFRQALKQQGMSEEQLRMTLHDRLLQQKLYDEIVEDVEVTDEEIEQYYNEHKDEFGQAASRDVRHILVSCTGNAQCARARAKAERLRRQIRGGADFGKLARQHSQDPGSARQGGRYTVERGQTVPEFERAAFDLRIGVLSQPVKTQFGFHLIQPLSSIRPPRPKPLKSVRDQIRQQLLQRQRSDAITDWAEETKKKYDDETRYQVGFRPPPTTTAAATQ